MMSYKIPQKYMDTAVLFHAIRDCKVQRRQQHYKINFWVNISKQYDLLIATNRETISSDSYEYGGCLLLVQILTIPQLDS